MFALPAAKLGCCWSSVCAKAPAGASASTPSATSATDNNRRRDEPGRRPRPDLWAERPDASKQVQVGMAASELFTVSLPIAFRGAATSLGELDQVPPTIVKSCRSSVETYVVLGTQAGIFGWGLVDRSTDASLIFDRAGGYRPPKMGRGRA